MINAFTVDLEEWFDGFQTITPHAPYERRLRVGFDKLMMVLERSGIRATFFVLGRIMEEEPEIIREILAAGHELASHAHSHRPLYQITREAFTADLQEWKRIADAGGYPYAGFRAPYFSVDSRSSWALDVLANEGFGYDSSIFPGNSWRTGIRGYRKDMHVLPNGLFEIPVSTFNFYGLDGCLGGAYFRLLPYSVFRRCFQRVASHRPAIFYIHPWELDPDQPHPAGLPKRNEWPHYYDLKGTEAKLERLLGDFEFGSIAQIIGEAEFGFELEENEWYTRQESNL